MIKTVARYFKWPPLQIDQLYLDEIDHFGLVYWFKDAQEQDREIKKLTKK